MIHTVHLVRVAEITTAGDVLHFAEYSPDRYTDGRACVVVCSEDAYGYGETFAEARAMFVASRSTRYGISEDALTLYTAVSGNP